jgi:hypothetical protein
MISVATRMLAVRIGVVATHSRSEESPPEVRSLTRCVAHTIDSLFIELESWGRIHYSTHPFNSKRGVEVIAGIHLKQSENPLNSRIAPEIQVVFLPPTGFSDQFLSASHKEGRFARRGRIYAEKPEPTTAAMRSLEGSLIGRIRHAFLVGRPELRQRAAMSYT